MAERDRAGLLDVLQRAGELLGIAGPAQNAAASARPMI